MGEAETGNIVGEAPKKKKVIQFCHWERPRSQLYEYNYDYGSYYYRPMIDYLDQRSRGTKADAPKPLFWEERALQSYMDRSRRTHSCRVNRDAVLLQSIRNSSSHYVAHSKSYAKKITGMTY